MKKFFSGIWWFTRGVGRLIAYALAGLSALLAVGALASTGEDASAWIEFAVYLALTVIFICLSEGWFKFQKKPQTRESEKDSDDE